MEGGLSLYLLPFFYLRTESSPSTIHFFNGLQNSIHQKTFSFPCVSVTCASTTGELKKKRSPKEIESNVKKKDIHFSWSREKKKI